MPVIEHIKRPVISSKTKNKKESETRRVPLLTTPARTEKVGYRVRKRTSKPDLAQLAASMLLLRLVKSLGWKNA